MGVGDHQSRQTAVTAHSELFDFTAQDSDK